MNNPRIRHFNTPSFFSQKVDEYRSSGNYEKGKILKLTHFWPMFPFYTPRKRQGTFDFLVFSGGIKWEHWPEMGNE